MQRRTFLELTAASTAASVTAVEGVDELAGTARAAVGADCGESSGVADLEFASATSLLDSNYGALTDSSVVAVWAESTATNTDADGDGNAYAYDDATDVPVVAVDGNVVGFGAMLVNDGDADWTYGNEEFVLNVWDEKLGGSGTVLWDEGHGQYYGLSKFSAFESYAEENGYAVNATSSLVADLPSADAAVITSPSETFTTSELNSLFDYVENGGVVFLHGQSDYSDYDETENLNDVAGYLQRSFRYNDDEVVDASNNTGANYDVLTGNFNESNFGYFSNRPGLGGGSGFDGPKTGTVANVTDGDTFDVDFDDGTSESVRVLGIDTPEKKQNRDAERVQEWEGIESLSYLGDWGANATDFATRELDGATVTVETDPEEGAYDAYDRLLGYVYYDADGDGNRDELYNRRAVERGYARVYGSGLTKHDAFRAVEATARANGTGVWGRSDPDASSEIRDRDVDDLFFPHASSVRTAAGAIADSRVPVYAESTATQTGGSVGYDRIPLVGVDESAGVGLVGSPFVDESYESAEGFAVDTSGYENFVLATNLLDYLGDASSGDVLIDGGHGQFGAEFALSSEDAAYYQRYLEGQDIGFEQVNDITSAKLSGARALVVTAPTECYASSEVDAIGGFLADGGAVVLLGSSRATDAARATLNDLANALGTDLRLSADEITDSSNNVNGDRTIPTTTAFDASFPLFSKYS
ncbi:MULTISPECIES: thermonuclease family protein [Halorussus]|uniref:thermonuclease family protein n=1 Tax=Halorussus TaxID=1070314 RepID=UPI0020A01FFD|nr:thermonuclease family protein [Halorussus vallis]USZ73859.1 thermonuclease family protein [Halorussus vallis]